MVLSDLIPTSSASASQCLGWNGINFCGITFRQTMGMGTRKRIGSCWQLTQFSWQRNPLRHAGTTPRTWRLTVRAKLNGLRVHNW
jgi:hypothetical protein